MNLVPATNYNSLTLKRLIYMNSKLKDFDAGTPSNAIIYKDGTPYQCFMNDVTWINNSKWGSYAYGPFQWLQMVNRCLYFIE